MASYTIRCRSTLRLPSNTSATTRMLQYHTHAQQRGSQHNERTVCHEIQSTGVDRRDRARPWCTGTRLGARVLSTVLYLTVLSTGVLGTGVLCTGVLSTVPDMASVPLHVLDDDVLLLLKPPRSAERTARRYGTCPRLPQVTLGNGRSRGQALSLF